MARNVPTLLAIACLFAACCWCSGVAQSRADSLEAVEVTAEAEVSLLQVEGTLMPRRHAASSDARAKPSAPVALSQALGSASLPAAPVLFVCLAVGVAAVGLLLVVLLHELYLDRRPSAAADSMSVRFMQAAVVSRTALDAAKYSSFIPLALDLAGEVGWSPALSGLFIAGINSGKFAGSVLARVCQPLLGHYLARRVTVAAVALSAVAELLVCALVLLQPTSWLHGYFIFGMRLFSGILLGLASMGQVIVRKCTPEKEHTPLSLSLGIATGVGVLVGPLMSTLVFQHLEGQQLSMEVADKVAAVILVCAILTALNSIMSSFSLPTSIEEPSEVSAGAEAVGDENRDAATGKASIQREALTLAAVLASLVVCNVSMISIEVSTSMLLEVQFDWSSKAIGYATSAGLGPTGLLSFACILLLQFEVVRVSTLVGCLLLQAVCGIVFLYQNHVIQFGGLQLLCSDFLLYPSVNVLGDVVNGEVFKIATKGSTLISPESAQMVVTITTGGLDIITVVYARWLLTVGGRNVYACSQTVLVCLMFLAFRTLFSGRGSEATTADAAKAVHAGKESTPEATSDGRLLEGAAK